MSRIRADKLVDRLGTGGPRFPNGVAEGFNVTGVITATSFSGDGSNLNAVNVAGISTVTLATFNDVLVGGALTVTGNTTLEGELTVTGNTTLEGNLTVNGTTTTIDTTLLDVDRIEVQANSSQVAVAITQTGAGNALIALGGKVGLGTNNPGMPLEVYTGSTLEGLRIKRYHTGVYYSDIIQVGTPEGLAFNIGDGSFINERLRITGAGNVGINSTVPRGTLDVQGRAHFNGGLVEKFENAGTTLGSQTNNPLADGNVILFTGNETGNLTINFTGVHSTLSVGENVSFTAIITPNNSGVINALQIDSTAQTIRWSGGSAPSASASGQDVYTFTILKTGTGTTDYQVFGAATNYAS